MVDRKIQATGNFMGGFADRKIQAITILWTALADRKSGRKIECIGS